MLLIERLDRSKQSLKPELLRRLWDCASFLIDLRNNSQSNVLIKMR